MRTKILLISMIVILSSIFLSCTTQKSVKNQEVELTNQKDSASYAFGMQIGKNIAQQDLQSHMNVENILAGIRDQINSEAKLSDEKTDELLKEFFGSLEKDMAKEKISQGETFLKENGDREEVVTLESGLQYEIIEKGEGESKPSETSTVTTHYEGTLIDGTVFDSSYRRGEPTSFPVNRVIPGWTEALQLMSVGDKWKLYIPYDLAYGEKGAGQIIGPYETLIFVIELIEIQD
jgi:FKBP-type peptidyl-prolyl cis-trans isomerase FklB